MNHHKLPDPMDITQYLQTEGRRIAAELGRRRSSNYVPGQQQCSAPASSPPRSLSETLQRMGVASAPTRRL